MQAIDKLDYTPYPIGARVRSLHPDTFGYEGCIDSFYTFFSERAQKQFAFTWPYVVKFDLEKGHFLHLHVELELIGD